MNDSAPTPPHAGPQTAAPLRAARWLAIALGLLAVVAWIALPWPDGTWLQQQRAAVLALHASQPLVFGLGLFLAFTLLSALALPGCGVLALAAGLCLGWVPGTLLVVLASTAGATLSFLAARHLWRDTVRRRFSRHLPHVEAGLARDGAFYLLALRLAPVIPYALINPLMGLSAMPTRQFFAVSGVGMLAGSAAYVYAGTALGSARGWQDLLTPTMAAALMALAVLAVLPWAVRALGRGRS